MSNDNLPERDKVILQGRIYPAIQSCVNNRYRIVLGIFIYYSFILTSDTFSAQLMKHNVNLFVSLIFTVFVLHNGLNYYLNGREEETLENRPHGWPVMELIFTSACLSLIWGGYILFQETAPAIQGSETQQEVGGVLTTMNVDHFISSLIGGGLALSGVLLAQWWVAWREERKHQENLNGVLQGIHDEIHTLWTKYKETIGAGLDALEDNKPFHGYYPLTQEYCIIYTQNASLIGQIKDHNLGTAIVTTYLMFKVMLDSVKVHNERQKEYWDWVMIHGQTGNVVHEEYAKESYKHLVQHTATLKAHHFEWKQKAEKLLAMLHNTGVVISGY